MFQLHHADTSTRGQKLGIAKKEQNSPPGLFKNIYQVLWPNINLPVRRLMIEKEGTGLIAEWLYFDLRIKTIG